LLGIVGDSSWIDVYLFEVIDAWTMLARLKYKFENGTVVIGRFDK